MAFTMTPSWPAASAVGAGPPAPAGSSVTVPGMRQRAGDPLEGGEPLGERVGR